MKRSPARSGAEARDEVLSVLEQNRAATILRFRRALLFHMLASPTGTGRVEDLRPSIPIPPGIAPQVLGAVPRRLQQAHIIEFVGYEKAHRPEAHARPLCSWRLVSRAKALAWLAENPDPDLTNVDPTGQRRLFGMEA